MVSSFPLWAFQPLWYLASLSVVPPGGPIYSLAIMKLTFMFFSVTCSTPTVTKCQAALRTLQAFPFFKPTCLCKVGAQHRQLPIQQDTLLQEPRLDPDCNQFKDFLVDHPCLNAKYKGQTQTFKREILIQLYYRDWPVSRVCPADMLTRAGGLLLRPSVQQEGGPIPTSLPSAGQQMCYDRRVSHQTRTRTTNLLS